MAIYRFSFDDKYAGHTATVTNRAGVAVTGSPLTLDASGDGALDLAAGYYHASVDNTPTGGDGYSVVDGLYDIEASIAAAGSGGGGILRTGTPEYLFEISNGATVSPQSGPTVLEWDSAPAGIPTGTDIALPAGLYSVWIELDFDHPAEDRCVIVGAISALTWEVGPLIVSSTTTGTDAVWGRVAKASGLVLLNDAVPVAHISLARAVTGINATPADLSIGYASALFNQIA